MEIDWEHVYLLGWYDQSGKAFLTTWHGDLPLVDVVVTGVMGPQIPLWAAEVPPGAVLHRVPKGRIPSDYAKEIGGLRAFGWFFPDGVCRITTEPLTAAGGSDEPQEEEAQAGPLGLLDVQAVERKRL